MQRPPSLFLEHEKERILLAFKFEVTIYLRSWDVLPCNLVPCQLLKTSLVLNYI